MIVLIIFILFMFLIFLFLYALVKTVAISEKACGYTELDLYKNKINKEDSA